MKKYALAAAGVACFLAGGFLFFQPANSGLASKSTVSFELGSGKVSSAFGPFAVKILPPKKYEKESVRFANGDEVKDWAYEMSYLGALWNAEGKAAVILSGTDCTGCDAEPELFIYSPAWKTKYELSRPGRIGRLNNSVNPAKEIITGTTRQFIGKCLADYPVAFVSIFQSFTEEREFNGSAITLEEDGRIRRHDLTAPVALTEIEERLKKKDCLEYAGNDQFDSEDEP